MNLIIIIAAIALCLGLGIIFLKIAKFLAEKGEGITKILFVIAFVAVGLACVAHFVPDAAPWLTKGCNVLAEAIRGFVKPFVA